jgi:hypothetical protein
LKLLLLEREEEECEEGTVETVDDVGDKTA